MAGSPHIPRGNDQAQQGKRPFQILKYPQQHGFFAFVSAAGHPDGRLPFQPEGFQPGPFLVHIHGNRFTVKFDVARGDHFFGVHPQLQEPVPIQIRLHEAVF